MKGKRWVAILTAAVLFGMTGDFANAKAPEEEAEWREVQRIIDSFADQAVWTSPQTANVVSDNMPVSAVMGNGAVGVTSYDNEVGTKQYLISRNDFWGDQTSDFAYMNRTPSIMTVGGLKLGARRSGELPVRSGNLLSGRGAEVPSGSGGEDALNGTGEGWLSQPGTRHVLTVELAEETEFNRWTLKPGKDMGVGGYTLEFSLNGQDWEIVDTADTAVAEVDKILVYPQKARYVRITAEMAEAESRAHILQFGIYREVNLASIRFGASASADSTMTTSSGNRYGANHTIDESYMDTGNYMNSGWVSVNNKNADNWLKIDLGQPRTFDRWVTAHTGLEYFIRILEAEGKNTSGYLKFTTRQYELQISHDGKKWETVDKVTENTAGQTDRRLAKPVNARYVRLYIPKGFKDQQGLAGDRSRIIKFQLYDSAQMQEAVTLAAESGYREEMDIARAEVRTWTELGVDPVLITGWMSATENLLVTKVESRSEEDTILSVNPYGSTANSKAAAKCRTHGGILPDGKGVWGSRRTNDGDGAEFISEAVIASQVVDGKAVETIAEENGAELRVLLPAGGSVTVVTAIEGIGGSTDVDAPEGEDSKAFAMVVQTLEKFDTLDKVEELHRVHLQWWQDYYKLSWVDYQDTDLNRIYYGQQYLFGSAVRRGNIAPGLYGIWRTSDNPRWQGNYHLNYNFQATWYGSFSGNRMYTFFEPYTNEILKYMDMGMQRAADPWQYTYLLTYNNPFASYVKQRFEKGGDLEGGIPGGVLYPVGITPFQQETKNGYAGQTMDAWFCAVMFMNYFDYTLDDNWLNTPVYGHTPYEFIRAVGTFYEKWLEKRDPRIDQEKIVGKTAEKGPLQNLEKYPAYSGGTEYVYVLMDGATESLRDCNPTGYLGVLKRLYDQLIRMSERLGLDEERRALWADIRDHLARPEDNVFQVEAVKDGQPVQIKILGYSENDYPNYAEGTIGGAEVQLELVQPGELWGFDSDAEILEICRNTIAYHNTWTYPNSIPKVYTHGARVGYDPEELVRRIKELAQDDNSNAKNNKMKKNYHIYDGQHGIEKVGLLEAMNNLMCQSDGGIIKIFPAWPEARGGSFTDIREKGAFLISSSRRPGQVPEYVEITSEKGEPLEMVNPWKGAAVTVTAQSGKVVEVNYGRTRNSGEYTFKFDTEPGERYTVVCEKATEVVGEPALTLNGETLCGETVARGQLAAFLPLEQTEEAGKVTVLLGQYRNGCLCEASLQESLPGAKDVICSLEIDPQKGDMVRLFVLKSNNLCPLKDCRSFTVVDN